jgi:RimJ/RimL family protein N-acetyltransferase
MNIDLNKIIHRDPKVSDAMEHFRAIQESYLQIVQYLPDFVGMDKWTVEMHKNYLRKFQFQSAGIRTYYFFYEDKLVGSGHLKPSGWEHSGELLYWVRSGWEGQGIGLHIATIMTRYAYSHLGYRFVIIETDKENLGSRKVAQKLGFKLGMIYGYSDHFGRSRNMAVWVKDSPMTKTAARFDTSYVWNPFSLMIPMRYRHVTQKAIESYLKPESGGGSPKT